VANQAPSCAGVARILGRPGHDVQLSIGEVTHAC
jgi:hypothetical protein